jgi:hypothetical protein
MHTSIVDCSWKQEGVHDENVDFLTGIEEKEMMMEVAVTVPRQLKCSLVGEEGPSGFHILDLSP